MGRAASNDAPTDPKAIMEARRAAYREEQGLPDVKWSCFAEQRKHEDFAAVCISASRRVETPSRHRRDSSPSDEVVSGFWSKFEPFRTASSDRDAPRRSSTSPCHRGGRRP